MKNSPTQNQIRGIAFLVFVLTLVYMKTNWIFIPFFLVIDFGLRAFGFGKYSPLSFISGSIFKPLKLKDKPVYFPPKQFAAKIGFLFSITILLLNIFHIDFIAVSIVLAVCAGLEAFFNFCVGCQFFNLLTALKNKAR